MANDKFERRPMLMIEDAQLIFKNFTGAPDKFDAHGHRQFNVRLDESMAEELKAQGWNVKPLRKRDEDEDQFYHMNVNVNYGGKRGPRITLIGLADGEEINRTELTEDTVRILDGSYIVKADITINPYEWEPGRLKGYLDQAYIFVEMSPLDLKYAQTEDDPNEY